MRKITLEIKVKLTVDMDEGIEVSALVDELDYEMESMTSGAEVMDTEILDYVVTDSR